MSFQKPKGTRDFYPEDFAVKQAVFSRLKSAAEKYGFKQVESPAFESLKLLTEKEGEEVEQEIFVMKKRGNEEYGLRFDLTVPLARMFIEKQKQLSKPVKWYYLTRMWRYESPQKGRAREFYQFGVEIFGSEKAEADAECIALAIDSLLALGLTEKDFIIKLNNRKLLQGLLYGLGINKAKTEDIIRIIDKSRKITNKEFTDELKKLKLVDKQIEEIKKIIKIKNIDNILKFELNNPASSGLTEIKDVLKILKEYGKDKFVELDLSIARGLTYYTGTIFEAFDKAGKLRSILAGGRYNNLVKQFGGSQEGATGFALGDATTELLLKEKGLLPKTDPGVDYYIAPINEKVRKQAINIANKLREKYKVEIDLMQRNLSRQLDYANSIKAKKVIIIGERDLAEKKVTIRDMLSGKEKKINTTEL